MNNKTTEAGGGKYIDLSSDIGFKICLGNPDNKTLMPGLLRALIPKRQIMDIEFLDPEIRPEEINDKRVRFDIRCIEPDGASFVVEMQKEQYEHMADRLVVYSGDPLKRLLKAGHEYDEIQPLYVVCIADFFFDFGEEDDSGRKKLLRTASLHLDDTGNILSDKYNFVLLQLPAVKELYDGQPFLEQVAYAIRNIHHLEEKPKELKDPWFQSLFEAAEKRYMSEANLKIYDNMIRDEIQIKAERDYAVKVAVKEALEKGEARWMAIGRAEGEAKGRAEGEARGEARGIEMSERKNREERIQSARILKGAGVDLHTISKAIGMTLEELERL